ncbi:MAG: hypothetical protein LBV74_21015 [Tannerella sp.]|jgi:predicted small secreted protein|nr:hypothetical protein [Tannerella sp.]
MKKLLIFMLMAMPFVFTSCSNDDKGSSDDIKIQKSKIELISGETEQIVATSDLVLSYTSEDEYFASVDNSGVVAAKRVGETNILIKNAKTEAKVSVIVSPKYTTYPDPNLMFGETRESVIKKLGTPTSETSDAIAYEDYSTKAPIIMYAFDGNTTNSKVNGVNVIVRTTYSEELAAYLAERYFMVGGSGDITLVGLNNIDPKKATLSVALSLYNLNYWMVMYMPYASSTYSIYDNFNIDQKKVKISKLLK